MPTLGPAVAMNTVAGTGWPFLARMVPVKSGRSGCGLALSASFVIATSIFVDGDDYQQFNEGKGTFITVCFHITLKSKGEPVMG